MSKEFRDRKFVDQLTNIDGKLTAYMIAAGGITALIANQAQSAIVANTAVQPFGINGVVNIDFNSDTQVDFQIDHDRYNLNGTNLDYLQIDKSDINGEDNVDAFDPLTSGGPTKLWYQPFPLNQSSHRNNDANVLGFTNEFGDQGGYAVALRGPNGNVPGDLIGGTGSAGQSSIPGTLWDWQEGSGFGNPPKAIRANRLIDEDHGQIDDAHGHPSAQPNYPFGPQGSFPGLDDFVGLSQTDIRYLGVRIDLKDEGFAGNEISSANGPGGVDNAANYWYGWIGIRITNAADATGEVVGYAYETVKGMSIHAGDIGPAVVGLPGDYNNDHVVNALDYTIWRNHFGEANETNLNNNGDGGTVAETDFTWWKQHYGDVSGPGGGGLAIPEPGSIVLAAIGGIALVGGFVMERLFGRRGR